MQKFADAPEIPITQIYKHVIGQSEPILPFEINGDMNKGPSLTQKLLIHPGTYIGTIGMIVAICVGAYCFKRSLFRPATLRYWPYSPVSLKHAIVDDEVEAVPIYRGGGTVDKPVRPHKNHDLHMEW